MEINDATLQAFLDGALSPGEHRRVSVAIEESAELRAQLAVLEARRAWVSAQMDAVAPHTRPDSARAWQRWQTENVPHSGRPSFNKRIGQVMKTSFFKRYQPALTAMALVAVLAMLFSFAPVRATAGNFLQIFRVRQIKVVPVDVSRMETLANNPDLSALLEQFSPETSMDAGGKEPQEVPSVADAERIVPFRVRVPKGVGTPTRIYVSPQTIATMKLDRDLLAAIFEAADIQVDLPASLNDTPLIITKPDTVMMDWAADGNSLNFIQMPTPRIEYPNDLDLNALGVAGLQLAGLSKVEAEALGATIDWANTLVLPIPTDADMSYREVTINGGQGLVFTNTGATDDKSALMWQTDGMSFFIVGNYTADELILLAESVR